MWLYVDGIPQGTAPNSTSANNTRDLNIGFAWAEATRSASSGEYWMSWKSSIALFPLRKSRRSSMQAVQASANQLQHQPRHLQLRPVMAARIQQPINANGTSIFSVRRGVVPVKFTLAENGTPTCALPPATISVTRTGGGVIGEVNESIYTMPADSGSNFRIDGCQYIYNLNSGALGVGIYRVDIKINGQVVGSATFELK